MNLTFSTFFLSGPVISLDDEDIAHRLLKRMLPSSWEVKCFRDQDEFTAEMERQLRLQGTVSHDLSHVLASWRENGTDLIESVLRFWNRQSERPANLVLIDFRMPYADGVELLSRDPLRIWEGRKLLLTAHADDRVAVDAFNRHLITQFVNKGSLAKDRTQTVQLMELIKRQGNALFERTWATQVAVEQMEVLEAAKEALTQIILREEWDEYVVIGQPFGILGCSKGRSRWLQLETEESLESLIEILENTGASEQDCAEVRERKSIMAVELGSVRPRTKKQPATVLPSKNKKLWGAVFDIDLNP